MHLNFFSRHSRPRRYEAEKRKKWSSREETISHPLRGITVTVSDSPGSL